MENVPQTALSLRSLVTEDGNLQLLLKESPVPEPGDDEVVVRIEATPINPSDQATLIAPADVSTGKTTGTGADTVYTAKVRPGLESRVKPRIGKPLAMGNEGAGIVVKAGSSKAAQALLGKTVAVMDGALYCQYRKVNVMQCMPLNEGTSARDGASCFVNPLTALGFVETMRSEGFKAIVHTAAASNLGQMLNRICLNDGIDLVNIVRKPEQVELLKSQGAKYVLNSNDENFSRDLTAAIEATGAYVAFDAIGGGDLGSRILTCMEKAALKDTELPGPYGSNTFKQLYVYGSLDLSPTVINRNFGFSWGVNAWLLTPFIQKVGPEKTQQLQKRVADELTTTFASHYSDEISLTDALKAEVVAEYSKQATGQKFLINPTL
ncbi:NADPH2:quinone reductase [Litorivivens lipolytica]|uniref:NADPH2:quinone reductase n=1 Tax=Litorivivens lipolytica TaxID=1524264 RepID=A0A7W4Z767_9GAMM|nr:zinc-binding dehydrogenase [Litorivivens lipolytica]MBB3047611.1 NADPH2:quinone reductase [Litorivivens lipolytica]